MVSLNKRIMSVLSAVMIVMTGCSLDKNEQTDSIDMEEKNMQDNSIGYVQVIRSDEYIIVSFDIENESVMKLGDRLNEIEEQAYMNGYNWDALIGYYLNINAPEVLIGLETDPEAGMYAGYYDNNDENMMKAQKLAECIRKMIDDPDELCEFVEENCADIPWD